MSNAKAAPIPEDLREGYTAMDQNDEHQYWVAQLIERIAALTAEVAALKAEIARRDAPVTDAEWKMFVGTVEVEVDEEEGIHTFDEMAERKEINALILARATPPQAGGKG